MSIRRPPGEARLWVSYCGLKLETSVTPFCMGPYEPIAVGGAMAKTMQYSETAHSALDYRPPAPEAIQPCPGEPRSFGEWMT